MKQLKMFATKFLVFLLEPFMSWRSKRKLAKAKKEREDFEEWAAAVRKLQKDKTNRRFLVPGGK